MLSLGAFGFASPWILLAGLSLPVIWWLLRVTPPSPQLVRFPPMRLLLGLRTPEEQPARTPLWLVILRMVLAALVILALARPVYNPTAGFPGSGPLILVVDNGWAAARNWPARVEAWEALIDQAGREGRTVRVVTTARTSRDDPIEFSDVLLPAEARERLRAVRPVPWPDDHAAVLAAATNLQVDGSAHVVWLSDGTGSDATRALAERLQRLGTLEVMMSGPNEVARLVGAPESDPTGFKVAVARAEGGPEAASWVRVVADDGRLLARARAVFPSGQRLTQVRLDLPGPQRNAAARIEVENERTAGAVFLLDERWRRRPVGLVSGEAVEHDQPLLSSLYYLDRALKPFSNVSRGTIAELVSGQYAVIMLADIGKLSAGQTGRLGRWIERGGVLVRFSGSKLAQNADSLLPVKLRSGGRALGGALSWTKPAMLAPFDETSPFYGLKIPGDVRIQRQVLAEPSLKLNDRTWARLTDGTPLVTAERRGKGWLVLFHTTANTDWSNLPISGLFVEMLRRVVDLSAGVVSRAPNAVLPPLSTLDGFGVLGQPPTMAAAIPAGQLGKIGVGPRSPPGYYGSEATRRALNLSGDTDALKPVGPLPPGVVRAGYGRDPAVALKPWLLLAALVLAIVDTLIGLALRGLLRIDRPRRGVAALGVLLLATAVLGIAAAGPAKAQDAAAAGEAVRRVPTGPDARALLATLETHLAYVITGDASVDETTLAGLSGLSRVLRRRTAVEPGKPLGVNLETDELAFYPMLYWAVSLRQRPPSDHAVEKLNQYLRSGGTILIDTRERGDFNTGMFESAGPLSQHLRVLLRGLDIPMLIPMPRNHVLTKSFYLLSEFPGRWAGGRVWVERRGGRFNDGVSSVVIGSNDWAGAWAVDRFGTAMFPVVPGGDLQREMAFRFGVNWVMYALTGNYKTDQVHVPAIIERLGQ